MSYQALSVLVRVAGGARCVGHGVKAGLLVHPDHVTLQIDFQRVFILLCRASMLRAVHKLAPGLAKFAASFYSKHSKLLVQVLQLAAHTSSSRLGCARVTLLETL